MSSSDLSYRLPSTDSIMNNTYFIPFFTNMLSLPYLIAINLPAVITATRFALPHSPRGCRRTRPARRPRPRHSSRRSREHRVPVALETSLSSDSPSSKNILRPSLTPPRVPSPTPPLHPRRFLYTREIYRKRSPQGCKHQRRSKFVLYRRAAEGR